MTTDLAPEPETNSMWSEIWAAFTLTGSDLEPDAITQETGLVPSRTWQRGDVIRGPMRRKVSGWSVKSPLSASDSLERHIEAVLSALLPSWPTLVRLGRVYDAELECVVKTYGGDRPALHLSSELMRRAAELGAALDIDLYVFR